VTEHVATNPGCGSSRGPGYWAPPRGNAPSADGGPASYLSGDGIYNRSTGLSDDVTSNEIAYRHRHLLWVLEQEHMAAALDLAYFAAGQSVSERHKPFC